MPAAPVPGLRCAVLPGGPTFPRWGEGARARRRGGGTVTVRGAAARANLLYIYISIRVKLACHVCIYIHPRPAAHTPGRNQRPAISSDPRPRRLQRPGPPGPARVTAPRLACHGLGLWPGLEGLVHASVCMQIDGLCTSDAEHAVCLRRSAWTRPALYPQLFRMGPSGGPVLSLPGSPAQSSARVGSSGP